MNELGELIVLLNALWIMTQESENSFSYKLMKCENHSNHVKCIISGDD